MHGVFFTEVRPKHYHHHMWKRDFSRSQDNRVTDNECKKLSGDSLFIFSLVVTFGEGGRDVVHAMSSMRRSVDISDLPLPCGSQESNTGHQSGLATSLIH